jgi:putative copper resistance protein D
MTASAVILLRFVQLGAAAILFGSSAFLLYSPLLDRSEAPHWTKLPLKGAAAILIVAAPLGFFLQTALLAGSFEAALDPTALHAALLDMNFGKSSIVRFVMALAACLVLSLLPSNRVAWRVCAVLGAVVAASFAWMGHGAASEGGFGWVHLAGDIVHCLAAAGWIGALVVFCLALYPGRRVDSRQLHAALAAFSGIGMLLVAAITLTGLINNIFLVGWNFRDVFATVYGRVLAAKLALFLLMLTLAAMNRYRHTPALASHVFGDPSLAKLRRSIGLETIAAFCVLALVSWLGTLQPVLAT